MSGRSTHSHRIVALLFVGTFLMQLAWIFTLPPYRGMDEFDHAYRAAAVAGGEIRDRGVPANGRGKLVTVPRSIVETARPICSSYLYTGHDNCNPVRDAGDGKVLVASAASAYNPVFYLVVGTVAKPFEGTTALYVMRLATALLCAALVALAGWVSTLWSRSWWPLVSLVTVITPTMLFSASVAAPNGIEMTGALVIWMALLGLHDPEASRAHARTLLTIAATVACVVVTVRSIGPVWVALIALAALLPLGPRRIRALVQEHPRLIAALSLVVLAVTSASAWWTVTSGANRLEPFETEVDSPVLGTLAQYPLWFLQAMAAFPRRHDPVPAIVYVAMGSVLLALVVAGFAVATRRLRLTILAVILVACLVPFVLTVPTIREAGPVWQGRYSIPLHVGALLVAGLALDRARPVHRFVPFAMVLGAALFVVAHVVATLHVYGEELATSPLAGSPTWVAMPAWCAAALLVLGCLAWAAALESADHGITRSARSSADKR